MFGKWKPSKSKVKEFVEKMSEIDEFCEQNDITSSSTNDSYYFTLNDIEYRVSNHTMQTSNSKAFNQNGEQVRNRYHNERDFEKLTCITASKTRLIEIYTDLKNGYQLDKRGNRKLQK